ncbi:MAG: AAA family ATPase [Deltaproteobacteria bacterium]|nr:AAA family ATPase [Deltaproteobacteria bacterium]
MKIAHASEDTRLADLLTALQHPSCYPHHPEQVEMIQTHISAVFLAGEEVYKLKKPVRFSFLDYSTLELRRHYCREEVRLNRRLAPSTYLGVVPVLRIGNDYRIREAVNMPEATVADYLVRMRRLPPERTLEALLAAGRVEKENIHTLAKRLAHFHLTAATKDAAVYGAPSVVWQALADNFTETRLFVGQTISEKQYRTIQDFSQRFFAEHQNLLAQRVLQDRVREGHGDLRCEHVYFLDQGIEMIDCIEFSPRLRTCDVASELAFLTMDMELHGAPHLAAELTHAYATQADDAELFTLLPFYRCYRAYVRGKVESLKSRQPEVPPQEQERARWQARRAFRLAYRYARGELAPVLLVVCGRVGTGKSTVAQLLGAHTGFAVFNSDVVRKRLAGLSPTARASDEYRSGVYSEDFTRRTYAALLTHAEEELHSGRGVIVDATCKQPADRRSLLALGERLNVPVVFVECRAPLAEVERRLRERERRGDSVSDATWEIACQQEADFPPFDDIPASCHQVIDTQGDLDEALVPLEEALSDRK